MFLTITHTHVRVKEDATIGIRFRSCDSFQFEILELLNCFVLGPNVEQMCCCLLVCLNTQQAINDCKRPWAVIGFPFSEIFAVK